MQNKNLKVITGANLRLATVGYSNFQIGCIFVEYDRIYIRFGIILTQFYINFSRQEHPIDVLYILLNE